MGKSTINGPFSNSYVKLPEGISWNFMGAAHSWRRVAIKVFRREEDDVRTSWDLSLGHFLGVYYSTTHYPPYHGQQLSIPSGNLLHSYRKIHHFQWEKSTININKSPFSIAFCMFTRGYHPILCGRNRLEQMLLASIGIYWLIGSFPCFESSGFQIGQIYDMQT